MWPHDGRDNPYPPYLYLALPLWLVAAVFTLAMLSILYFTAQPVLRPLGGEARYALARRDRRGNQPVPRTDERGFSLGNNTVLVLAVVGVTTLWAQSGMQRGQRRAVHRRGAHLLRPRRDLLPCR